MKQINRIIKNINDLSSKIKKEKIDPQQTIHQELILQNLELIIENVKTEPTLNTNTHVIVWYDFCYWLNHITWTTEIICYKIPLAKDILSLLHTLGSHTLGFSYLCSRFINYTNFPSENKTNLKELLTISLLAEEIPINNSISIFLYFFRKIDCFLKDYYLENYKDIPLKTGLRDLFNDYKDLTKGIDKNDKWKAFENKFEKHVEKNITFDAVIRCITEKKLSKDIRKKHLVFWLFYMHLRNAIMHKDGISTVDIKINLWDREFELKKDISFRESNFKPDSYINFTLSLVNIFTELFVKDDDKLWLSIQNNYFSINPEKK